MTLWNRDVTLKLEEYFNAIAELGSLSTITPELLENLFALDLAYLQEFYNRINQDGEASVAVHCPACNHRFRAELELSGES